MKPGWNLKLFLTLHNTSKDSYFLNLDSQKHTNPSKTFAAKNTCYLEETAIWHSFYDQKVVCLWGMF